MLLPIASEPHPHCWAAESHLSPGLANGSACFRKAPRRHAPLQNRMAMRATCGHSPVPRQRSASGARGSSSQGESFSQVGPFVVICPGCDPGIRISRSRRQSSVCKQAVQRAKLLGGWTCRGEFTHHKPTEVVMCSRVCSAVMLPSRGFFEPLDVIVLGDFGFLDLGPRTKVINARRLSTAAMLGGWMSADSGRGNPRIWNPRTCIVSSVVNVLPLSDPCRDVWCERPERLTEHLGTRGHERFCNGNCFNGLECFHNPADVLAMAPTLRSSASWLGVSVIALPLRIYRGAFVVYACSWSAVAILANRFADLLDVAKVRR
jgi:hypothetical protein